MEPGGQVRGRLGEAWKPGGDRVSLPMLAAEIQTFGLELDRTPRGLVGFGLQVVLTREMRRVEGASDPFARQATQGAPADGANAGTSRCAAHRSNNGTMLRTLCDQ